ncbi:MAG: hypothetical protein GY913_33030 [Proteobacteria bacterium]|nr:hypothetical protein [Pseudomonadota bacterium]MCP4921749.1 hypothetical protein [Pseudomonadota bacterium]
MSDRPAHDAGRHAWATLAIVAWVAGLHAVFLVLDARAVRDPGSLYRALPDLYFALGSPETWGAGMLSALTDTSGWWNLAVAAWLRLAGRSHDVVEWASWAAGLTLVGGVAWLARRLDGARAGTAAAALAAAIPALTLQARVPRVHVIETAALLLAVGVVHRDPKLQRVTTLVALGGLGAFLLNLRGTGVVWVVTLAAFVIWGARDRLARVGLVGLCWLLASLPPLWRLSDYVGGKVDAKARYIANQPSVLEDLVSTFEVGALALVVLGVGLALRRDGPGRRPLAWLLLSWSVVATAIFVTLRAGLTNYLPFVAGLAVVAGAGLARHRALIAITAALAIAQGVRWSPWGPAPDLDGFEALDRPDRPWEGWGTDDVQGLLDASCRSDDWHGCHVVVGEGLTRPGAHDPGQLALFLMAEDRVELRTVDDTPPAGWAQHGLDALVLFECGEASDAHYRRTPRARSTAAALIRSLRLVEIANAQVTPACSTHWYTPLGQLDAPVVFETRPLSADLLDALTADFAARNPEFASRPGTAPLYTEHNPLRADAPPGWR